MCVFEGCGELKDEAFMDSPHETALPSAAFRGHFLDGAGIPKYSKSLHLSNPPIAGDIL